MPQEGPHGQAICDNSGWMGGYEESTKKWTKPKETKAHQEGHAWKESDDWMGSPGGAAYSPKRNSKAPIKIEGMTSSIKNNPFLKNNH